MFPFIRLLLFVFLLAGLASCSTELEVNAPYVERKVIYAILDPTKPNQIIRVSKGFLTDGRSALEVAKIPDSVLFDPRHLRVELIEDSLGMIRRQWICKDTIIPDKDPGIFYHPEQLSFKTPNIQLNTRTYGSILYTVRVTNLLTNSVSEGKTDLPSNQTNISSPISDIPGQPPSIFFPARGESTIRILKTPSVQMVQMQLAWDVTVFKESGDTLVEKWVMNSPGTFEGFIADQKFIEGKMGPGTLWNFLNQEVRKRGNTSVVARKLARGNLEVYFANGEFYRYKTVNNNYNIITQSLPIYTNVTNGLGVVCARNFRSFPVLLDQQNRDSVAFKVPDFRFRR